MSNPPPKSGTEIDIHRIPHIVHLQYSEENKPISMVLEVSKEKIFQYM